MLLCGIVHLLCGVLFLLFSERTVQGLVVDPPAPSVLLVRGLGGILIAFGTLNVMAHNAPDGPAVRAVLAGTLVYLLITTGFDVRWTVEGLLLPMAWITIAVRTVFAIVYAAALFIPVRNG